VAFALKGPEKGGEVKDSQRTYGMIYKRIRSVAKEGFEMNRLTKIAVLVVTISLALGCAEREQIVIPADVPEDHPHKYAYTRSVGENHIHFHVNHRKGSMYVCVTDIYEQPMHLPVQKIEAKITTPDGTVQTLELYTPKIRMPSTGVRRRPLYTARYSRQADWLKNIHEFTVEVEVPIEDKIYVVSFDYRTSPKPDIHHRHE
jgi:hypothetical protein